MAIFLGIDVGTSAVKASLLESDTGACLASSPIPDAEIPRYAPQPGWCEQDPNDWWLATVAAIQNLPRELVAQVAGIGIAYQMHGLVLVDPHGNALRRSIIWSDGRATAMGDQIAEELSTEEAKALLNHPGNFTAAKIRWVRKNEPGALDKAYKIMLPGDYIAMKLSGEATTTNTGLSEMIAWDFERERLSEAVWLAAGATLSQVPTLVPICGQQGTVTKGASEQTGIPAGTPICYRAGDQPNNALSLNVLRPGEVATTVGTSGVLFAVHEKATMDESHRVNTFVHVNQLPGTLLCVNGAGGFYSWMRRTVGASSFSELNQMAEDSAIGANGVLAIPYGNGPERSLGNREPGASISPIDVNRHTRQDLARAAQEGIIFAMRLGADVLAELGAKPNLIRAGTGNMFKSRLYCQSFATVLGATLELYETDGAVGAARGAAVGAGAFASLEESGRGLSVIAEFAPDPKQAGAYESIYCEWKRKLSKLMDQS